MYQLVVQVQHLQYGLESYYEQLLGTTRTSAGDIFAHGTKLPVPRSRGQTAGFSALGRPTLMIRLGYSLIALVVWVLKRRAKLRSGILELAARCRAL